jgi:hypothetical protein
VNQSVRIRDMPGEEFGTLLRSIGPEIGRLMKRGDKLAIAVYAYFIVAHEHPNDPQARMNVRVAVEDYMNRDLRTAEQYDLGSKFGHRLPEPEKDPGPRIFVPESIVKQ